MTNFNHTTNQIDSRDTNLIKFVVESNTFVTDKSKLSELNIRSSYAGKDEIINLWSEKLKIAIPFRLVYEDRGEMCYQDFIPCVNIPAKARALATGTRLRIHND